MGHSRVITGWEAAVRVAEKEGKLGLEEERRLVSSSQNGDRQAFRVLVEQYQSKVFSMAYGILRSREDAQDITQETFVKAYISLKNFEGKSSFYTWVYRIAFNMAIDFKRRAKRRGGNGIDLDEAAITDSAALSAPEMERPDQEALRKERATAIDQALRELSEEHRAVVVLREVDGLSYDEIAQVTGISKGTVMSRLHYARKRLQERLRDVAPDVISMRGDEEIELG